MTPLEDDYRGDDDWNDFAKYYLENYLDENTRKVSCKINGHLDIAAVIYGKSGLDEGLWWVEQKVSALENKRPMDCLEDPFLVKRLKVCLMRMR